MRSQTRRGLRDLHDDDRISYLINRCLVQGSIIIIVKLKKLKKHRTFSLVNLIQSKAFSANCRSFLFKNTRNFHLLARLADGADVIKRNEHFSSQTKCCLFFLSVIFHTVLYFIDKNRNKKIIKRFTQKTHIFQPDIKKEKRQKI